jgi:hypothetical protein
MDNNNLIEQAANALNEKADKAFSQYWRKTFSYMGDRPDKKDKGHDAAKELRKKGKIKKPSFLGKLVHKYVKDRDNK